MHDYEIINIIICFVMVLMSSLRSVVFVPRNDKIFIVFLKHYLPRKAGNIMLTKMKRKLSELGGLEKKNTGLWQMDVVTRKCHYLQ